MTSSSFPTEAYGDPGDYLTAYAEMITAGWRSIDRAALRQASEALLHAYQEGRQVFVCGNGGSAAIADHLECDHLKGVHNGTDLSPQVRSLAANVALLTAIANDFAYDEVFAFPLARLSREGDVLLTISSSGNSPNIIKAIECAQARGLTTIAMTGFDGGQARRLAQISLHVEVGNYGVVEDIHQGLMHVLSQYIRQSRIEPDRVATLRF
jgi:D-sedoheptulose 7-phosphate isomerase/D-glycero-D-manno-heptose 1,7-bisphosphate phosphatase